MAHLPKVYYVLLVGLMFMLSGCELPRDSAATDVPPVNALPPTLAPLGAEVITPTEAIDVATVMPTVVSVQPVVTAASTETIVIAVTPAVSPIVTETTTTPTVQPTSAEPIIVDAPTGSVANPDTPAAANPPMSNTTGNYGQGFNYVVQPGDTLFGLSQRFGVSAEAIIAANSMSDDIVRIGQSLLIPQSSGVGGVPSYDSGYDGVYVVQSGDTLFSIARQFNTTVEALISANNLTPPFMIYAGQSLSVSSGYGQQPTYTQPDYQQPSYDTPEYQPMPGNLTHTVGAGETLFSIAARYGTTAEALALANGLTNPNQIYVGQVLYLPN